jgi:NAD(P)-dependent dehydrogenase (short-subunit alcohol dehydrogenase family)
MDITQRSAKLEGKVAIVTGAGSGIGAAIAERMAQEGALVVLADLNREATERRAKAIGQDGGRAHALALDLGDEASIRALLEGAVGRFGAIDVLVNNAANTFLSSTSDRPLEELEIEVWDELMRVNLRGTMLACKFVLPYLRARGGGSIVNIASVSGMSGGANTAYGVGKAGVIMLTRDIATQYGKEGIRCNAISPGVIVTPATSAMLDAGPVKEIMLRAHLTPRLGNPIDIAHAVVYLASDEAAFVTGQVMNVDGGLLAHLPYSGELAALAIASR